MPSFPCVDDLIPCGPAKYGFDAPGGGQVLYWWATFEVVARVFRAGTTEAADRFYFLVLDKRRIPAEVQTVDDAPAALWEWRDEVGRPCEEPAGVVKFSLATERDYYGRILPGLKRIEHSFFDSFDTERRNDTSQSEHYDVRSKKWVKGLPSDTGHSPEVK